MDDEFRAALGSVMGCGGNDGSERLPAIRSALAPMWKALPKNRHGRVEWRMLRYAAHRYFMSGFSLLVRGFEPSRQVVDSDLGTADILNAHVPSIFETVFQGKHNVKGFSFDDAVLMVGALEQVIFDSESKTLEKAYQRAGVSVEGRMSEEALKYIIESYVVHWMLGNDQESIDIVLNDRKLLVSVFPHWDEIHGFAMGQMKALQYQRHKLPEPGHSKLAMSHTYSFEEAHQAVGQLTKGFASFWDTECQAIKQSLAQLDTAGTGRVPIGDFYGANVDGEWRFGESEEYLRELGALDETSAVRGKQVIIPNYLQGASNCIVNSPHYLVCCLNECEGILNTIEEAIGAPYASPSEILPLVKNVTDFDDEPTKVDSSLVSQLRRVAEMHDGQVPLHGRLFAQWLHFVFPRECPFPHKAGQHATRTILEFGDHGIASKEDVLSQAAARRTSPEQMEAVEEAQWMSQWSEEEELYSVQLAAPWEGSRNIAYGGTAVVALGVLGSLFAALTSGKGPHGASRGLELKSHMV